LGRLLSASTPTEARALIRAAAASTTPSIVDVKDGPPPEDELVAPVGTALVVVVMMGWTVVLEVLLIEVTKVVVGCGRLARRVVVVWAVR